MSLVFSQDNKYLACSSNTGTIHIFKLKTDRDRFSELYNLSKIKDNVDNSKSSLSLLKGYLPTYFSSEWSFVQYRTKHTKIFVSFGKQNNKLLLITDDGFFYKISIEFENNICKCVEEEQYKFS